MAVDLLNDNRIITVEGINGLLEYLEKTRVPNVVNFHVTN